MPVSVSHTDQAQAWELQGKLLIQTPEDKSSLNLYWLHSPDSDQFRLTTALGTSVLSLDATPQQAVLEFDGETYRDADAQNLLSRVSGWAIPLQSLPLWVTGQQNSGDNVVSQDAQGRTLILTSATVPPWKIQYNGWQQQGGVEIPRQLTVIEPTLKLKIEITRWQPLTDIHALQDER